MPVPLCLSGQCDLFAVNVTVKPSRACRTRGAGAQLIIYMGGPGDRYRAIELAAPVERRAQLKWAVEATVIMHTF